MIEDPVKFPLGERDIPTLEDPEFSEMDMDAALARLPEAPAIA